MNVLDKHINALEKGLTTASAKQTEQIAYALAPLIPANQVLAFHGELGVGKTTFIRALAKSWGIKEHLTSPTYNLYKIYQSSNRCLVHLDAYRLDKGAELESLMIDDFLHDPWCLAIEWPEKIEDSMLSSAWHFYLSIEKSMHHHLRLVRT